MSLEELKFASIEEALQYLSDVAESKVVIAARIQPKAGDYVILLNPRTDHYHVFKYPKGGVRQYGKEDAVVDVREKGTGKEMIYPDSKSTESIAKNVSDMVAALIKSGQMDINGIPGIYIADSVSSDLSTGIEDKSKVDFETDRVYRGISHTGLQKSIKQIEQDKERRQKQVNKAPKQRYKVQENKFDPYRAPSDVSKSQLQEMFTSSDEALQYLADMTGKRIVIE